MVSEGYGRRAYGRPWSGGWPAARAQRAWGDRGDAGSSFSARWPRLPAPRSGAAREPAEGRGRQRRWAAAEAEAAGPAPEEASPSGQEREVSEADASEAAGEEGLPRREDDLSLEEVPEDMREPVQGNLELKRLLSTELQPPEGAAKKRKLSEGRATRGLEGAKADALAKWRLEGDVGVVYVLESADMDDVDAILRSNWHPNKHDEKNSCAEQIGDRLIRARETKFPSGGPVDYMAAFKHRWKLSNKDEKLVSGLCHKDMRYIMSQFDSTRPIEELVDEAGLLMPDEDRTIDAAPDKPGLFTLGRFNRLELIDPVADALVVGDANLTFSLLLAEHREDLGHVGRIVATTFETIETLRERYDEIDSTVKKLEDQNAEVLHNVDCTRLAVDPRFVDMAGKFGAVYYNFPHAGVMKGFFDSHPFVRWRHENLMQLFFRALRSFVKPGGSVKVSSNSNATGVRYSDIMFAAMLSEFVHVETVPFLEWRLRGYRRSYGDRRDATRRPEDGEIYKSQRAQSDMVYCFRYEPSGGTPPKPRISYPPAKQDLLDSHEGFFKGQGSEAKRRRVEEIYREFLSYVQGIHVG